MPDYFTDITAQEAVKCSPGEAGALIKALIGDQKPEETGDGSGLRATHPGCCLSIDYDRRSGEVYIFGADYVDLDQIPETFLKALAALLCKQGKEYLEFGYANTCSRHCPGSHEGGRFRIDAGGSIIEPRIMWPGPRKLRRKP